MKAQKVQEILALVKNNYQEIAEQFNTTRKKEIWPKIRELVKMIPENSRILDLGCGNGRLLEALIDKKLSYLGVDNSSELIRLAKNNYPTQTFLEVDLLELTKIKEDEFDYIFCLATLQHIPSRKLRVEALKQMALKLKAGGELIMSNWNLWAQKKYRLQLFNNYFLKLLGKNKLDFNDVIFPWKSIQGEKISLRYYHAFTKRELKKIAHLAGLKIIKLERDQYNFWLVLKNK